MWFTYKDLWQRFVTKICSSSRAGPFFATFFPSIVQTSSLFFITVLLVSALGQRSVIDCTRLFRSTLRGAWSDRDTNDIFAHCSLIFYYLDFKFSNFVCPSELHPFIWFFLKNSFRKKKNIRKTFPNALASSIFIVWSIVLKLGTPLLHIQAQNTLLQNF